MPGRITDELRRVTRQQGGVVPPPEDAPVVRQSVGKRYGPLIALGVIVVLAGMGWILVQKLMNMSRMEDCVMSGRKNCAPIDTTGK